MFQINIYNDRPGGQELLFQGNKLNNIKYINFHASYNDYSKATVTFFLTDAHGNLIGEEIDGQQMVAEATMDLYDYINEYLDPYRKD